MIGRPLLICAIVLALAACATTPKEEAEAPPQPIDPAVWVQKQQEYLAANAAKPGWKTTPSGLQYLPLKTVGADKPKPAPGANVTVHYVGKFIDGRTFDSSRERNQPATFPLDGVIKGWGEGVPMMRIGETWRFVIPAPLAYGERDRPPIPPGSTLVFEIELLGVAEGQTVPG
jgi:FKBP-type peptidyl-prolyl cis-trans isomerase FkpA